MIVIDTNIISEAMRPQPNTMVLEWLNLYSSGQLFITAVSLAEIAYGLRVLSDGKRKDSLQRRFEQFIALGFSNRILVFDAHAAAIYAEVMGHNREIGHPMSFADAQIVAITKAHGFSLATRNVKDFKFCDVELINPFLSV
ncbi:MAG: PIN domain-containing protein [Methylococcaceae bacterium]|nr:PIN domain-containing protein [Methylococcaceae bacterium]